MIAVQCLYLLVTPALPQLNPVHSISSSACGCADMGARTRQKEAISNVIVERIRRRLRHNALRNHIVLQVSLEPCALSPELLSQAHCSTGALSVGAQWQNCPLLPASPSSS